MRTTELHKLREERSRHLQQLDQLEKTKDLLEKANARVEDLTVQLATKTELERYVGNFAITKHEGSCGISLLHLELNETTNE